MRTSRHWQKNELKQNDLANERMHGRGMVGVEEDDLKPIGMGASHPD